MITTDIFNYLRFFQLNVCVNNKHNNLGKYYDFKVKHFIVKMMNSEEFLRNVAFNGYTYDFFF